MILHDLWGEIYPRTPYKCPGGLQWNYHHVLFPLRKSTGSPVSILLLATNLYGFHGQGFGGKLVYLRRVTQVTLPHWRELKCWIAINRPGWVVLLPCSETKSICHKWWVTLTSHGDTLKLYKHLFVWFRLKANPGGAMVIFTTVPRLFFLWIYIYTERIYFQDVSSPFFHPSIPLLAQYLRLAQLDQPLTLHSQRLIFQAEDDSRALLHPLTLNFINLLTTGYNLIE